MKNKEELVRELTQAHYMSGAYTRSDIEEIVRDCLAKARSLYPAAWHEGVSNGIQLDPESVRTLMEWAGIGEEYDEDDACPVTLWLGTTVDEDDKTPLGYGLNVYNDECPEHGSVCLVELPKPEDAELDEALFEKMEGILTRTANALKGEPGPLALHSWHDLPEVAAAIVASAKKEPGNG